MDLLVTPTAEHFNLDARRLSDHPQNDARTFPDGEVYVQIEELESVEEATLVHSGQPRPNRGLAYLHGALDLLRAHDCATALVVTYAPYCRQDAAFYEGTLNYARSLLRTATDYYGIDQVYAIDPHFGHREWVEEFPLEVLESFPLVRDRVEMDDYVVVGPDLGAVERFGISGFEKTRESAADVELAGELDVAGRNVLVFDDLVATGGTMVGAYERLKDQGAATIQAAAVHGALEEGVDRVRETYDALYLTNTVRRDAANVRVEPLIENAVG